MQGIPTKMKAVLLKGHGGFDQLELLKTSSAIWPLSMLPWDVWGAMPKPTTQIAGVKSSRLTASVKSHSLVITRCRTSSRSTKMIAYASPR